MNEMELIGLLPGLSDAAQRSVERLNEVRAAVHMPPVVLTSPNGKRRGRPPGSKKAVDVQPPPEVQAAPAEEQEKPNRLSPKGRKAIGNSTSRRWAIVREAGMHSSTMPTNAMVAKALKKIERMNALA
jgi:hypothetical protein